MRMEKVNKRLADWGNLLIALAECTCAVALSRGIEDFWYCREGCSFHLGKASQPIYSY